MSKVRASDVSATNELIPDLEEKADAAINASKKIASFITESESKLQGEVYDAMRLNLEVYQEGFNKLSKLCILLSNNMNKSNSDFLAYINECIDDDPVNDERIPIHEKRIKEINNRIAYLETIPKTVPKYDEESKTTIDVPNEPEYTNARNEIATLNMEKDKLKKIIEYLERLVSEDGKAVNTLSSIESEIREFVDNVNSLDVSNIQ